MSFTVRIDGVPLSFKAYRLSLLITIFYVQNQPTDGESTDEVGAERHDVSLKRFAKSLLPVRRTKHEARRPRLKSPGPSSFLRPDTPPLDPDLSFPHPLSACRRGPRPRVSICGQCTLLHEPRPFTEGPRNATALNNHPPEDRRPCAPERAQEAQENKAGIRIRQIAERKCGGRILCTQ